MGTNHCIIYGVTLTLFVWFGCGPTKSPGPDELDGPQSISAMSPSLRATIDGLRRSMETESSVVRLYQRGLKHLDVDNITVPTIDPRDITLDSSAELTAKLYLGGKLDVKSEPKGESRLLPIGRQPTFESNIELLCSRSASFREGLLTAFNFRSPAPICNQTTGSESGSRDNLQAVDNIQAIKDLIRRSLAGRTAIQRKDLLLLATSSHSIVLAPLLALPPIDLGKPTKKLSSLSGLELALVIAGNSPKHREIMEARLKDDGLTPRERARLILALAWHEVPSAQNLLPELLGAQFKNHRPSSDALLSIIGKISNPEILAKVLAADYESNASNGRISHQIRVQKLEPKYWIKLLSTTLSRDPKHIQAWRDLAEIPSPDQLDWPPIISQTPPADLPLLIRQLKQFEIRLPLSSCETLKSRSLEKSRGAILGHLLMVLENGRCLSDKELQRFADLNLPAAILLQGKRAQFPHLFFLEGLRSSDRNKVIGTAKAILLDPKISTSLEPTKDVLITLGRQLKRDKDSFHLLRLLKTRITAVPSDQVPALSRVFLNQLKPFVLGKSMPVYTDALTILEHIGTASSLKLIRQSLRSLEPGQAKVKLLARFGHVLGAQQ